MAVQLALIVQTDLRRDVGRIGAPALVLTGPRDALTPTPDGDVEAPNTAHDTHRPDAPYDAHRQALSAAEPAPDRRTPAGGRFTRETARSLA